ncbi:hypothetical protein BWQ96_01348 [Gracilariopsis chorda]|uniref:CAAX prenyl protease 2/Lysostaphin resistance protein A-like domain-containing protein n=1 Tax=Gracilariopsis chorda TaxID=448386 RepID=A0A2V3J3U0_9FLOR|nr:hypothetical protein BWQ96_01348 [Gracilariopsis chorda]|eukprot:PXF48792.1 hypothetical protein BWQ96_01348 [Gracilariopsis chorda]
MDDADEFPKIPETGGRGHAMEATAAMIWTLLFLAYSSSTFLSEFSRGWAAAWTAFLVIVPVTIAGTPKVLERRPGAVLNLICYMAYGLVPSFIQLMQHADITSLSSEIADLVTVLIIWLPLELKLLSEELSATGKVTAWGLLTAALNIVNIFSVLRPFSTIPNARDLGYTFKVSIPDILVALVCAMVHAFVGMVTATVIRFARFTRPSRLKPEREVLTLLGMYMSGLAEELLFRGVIQNMLEQRLGQDSLIALIVASVAYGVAHLRKPKQGFSAPNIRYAVVTASCGIFCGLAWRITGKVTASAVTHAVGDYLIWRAFLRKSNET